MGIDNDSLHPVFGESFVILALFISPPLYKILLFARCKGLQICHTLTKNSVSIDFEGNAFTTAFASALKSVNSFAGVPQANSL